MSRNQIEQQVNAYVERVGEILSNSSDLVTNISLPEESAEFAPGPYEKGTYPYPVSRITRKVKRIRISTQFLRLMRESEEHKALSGYQGVSTYSILEGFTIAFLRAQGRPVHRRKLVDQLVTELIRDQELTRTTAWINGIYVDTPVTLNTNSIRGKFRRATREELGHFQLNSLNGNRSDEIPTCVFEFEAIGTPRYAQEHVQIVATLFMITFPWKVSLNRYAMKPHPFVGSISSYGSGPSIWTGKPRKFTRAHASRMERLSKLFDIGKLQFNPNETNSDLVAVELAMKFLSESLYGRVPRQEYPIAAIMMGLEALLSDTDSEISFKLRTFCGALIEQLTGEGSDTVLRIKRSYDVRSAFAHGKRFTKWSSLYKGLDEDLNEFEYKLRRLLRNVILCQLIVPKSILLNKIENGLTSRFVVSELREMTSALRRESTVLKYLP